MRAATWEVAGPPLVQRDGWTISSPAHSPANTLSLRCSSSGVGAARWSWAIGSGSLDGLYDLLRGIIEVIGRRHVKSNLAHGSGDAFGNDVALHDAAEDVDQDALHIGIGGDDLEGGRNLLLAGAAADIEEVRRRHAVELDDVHRRHRKARAIDHAADGAIERDIVEVVSRRFDFLGVFLGLVAQYSHFGMTKQGVVVERDLGVEHAQLLLPGDNKRVDLQ